MFQKGRIAENDLLINRVDELTALIVIVRNKVLFGNLFVYQDPMIYPSNLLKATGQFLDFCFNIIKSPVDWYRDLTTEQKNTVDSNVFTVILAIGATLAVGYMLRRLIIRHLGYKQNLTAPPPYFTKVMAAFFVACAYGVIPAVLLGSFLVWVIHTKILTIGFFGIALSSALYYVLYIFLPMRWCAWFLPRITACGGWSTWTMPRPKGWRRPFISAFRGWCQQHAAAYCRRSKLYG